MGVAVSLSSYQPLARIFGLPVTVPAHGAVHREWHIPN